MVDVGLEIDFLISRLLVVVVVEEGCFFGRGGAAFDDKSNFFGSTREHFDVNASSSIDNGDDVISLTIVRKDI